MTQGVLSALAGGRQMVGMYIKKGMVEIVGYAGQGSAHEGGWFAAAAQRRECAGLLSLTEPLFPDSYFLLSYLCLTVPCLVEQRRAGKLRDADARAGLLTERDAGRDRHCVIDYAAAVVRGLEGGQADADEGCGAQRTQGGQQQETEKTMEGEWSGAPAAR